MRNVPDTASSTRRFINETLICCDNPRTAIQISAAATATVVMPQLTRSDQAIPCTGSQTGVYLYSNYSTGQRAISHFSMPLHKAPKFGSRLIPLPRSVQPPRPARITAKLPLVNSGSLYSLHHRFIEMLKSHCCSSVSLAASGAQAAVPVDGSSLSPAFPAGLNPACLLARVDAGKADELVRLAFARVDSTYFSRVFAQKDAIRHLTRTHLVQPLAHMRHTSPGGHTAPDWLAEVLDLNRLAD
ncbi:unnamed protein product [Protopolystoma xenopodis]|uniref:Uncharacterized protein n=1 Tax=Protopolystoma xenopodis TaxID=117903 RepID=A0A448WV02_9PLAT|nr:unnamed protein product [Protopolystoma xenopodis]